MSSLAPVTIRCMCYAIVCKAIPGNDYPTLYIGTSNMLNIRIATHCAGAGSRWTRAHAPTGVIHEVSICPGNTQESVLAHEDARTLAAMRLWCERHGPDVWRSVRGGRWAKVLLTVKPPFEA